MNFTEPLPLTDVLKRLDAKTPIGSAMRTKEWALVPQGLRDSAFFSASVTEARFLDAQKKAIRQIIDRARETNEKGESYWAMDRSRFVMELRRMGEDMGILHPAGRTDGKVKENDITDPISIARLKLVVNTQLEMAYGEGQWRTAMDEDILNEWPAWELARISPRRIPRDWPQRWKEAGGTLQADGRMIALKTDDVWLKLSRFKRPHPPFDFNSGMGVEEIDRDEAESLGLMSMSTAQALDQLAFGHLFGHTGTYKADAKQRLEPNVRAFEESLEAGVKGLGRYAKRWLVDHSRGRIQLSDDGESVRWAEEPPVTSPRSLPPEIPCSKAVRVADDVNQVMAGAMRDMMSAADGVMNGFHARPIPAVAKKGPGHYYNFNGAGEPQSIELGEPGGIPHLEAAHELGHFWAHANLPPLAAGAGVPADFTRHTSEWLNAALASEPVKHLTQALAHTGDDDLKERLFEMLQPSELWARSFSQWLAVRSGNKAAQKELSRVVSGLDEDWPADLFWDNASFRPLLQPLDDLLLK